MKPFPKSNIHRIFRLIQDGQRRSIQEGHRPSEVWLGPPEREALKLYAENSLVAYPTVTPKTFQDGEGARVMGLRVFAMTEPGVRVGKTW
jgi:hypothetical protein